MLADIGDVLVSTPALALLRQHYPEAHISVVVRQPMARLLAGNPGIDECIFYSPGGLRGKFKLLWRMFREDVDLWVDLHTPTFNTVCPNSRIFRRNSVLRILANPKLSAGYDCDGALRRHTHGVPPPTDDELANENVVSTTLRVVQSLVQTEDGSIPPKSFYVTDEESRWALRQLASTAEKKAPTFGLFFGSKQPSDVWSVDNCSTWAKETLGSYPDARILLLGGLLEAEGARKIIEKLPESDRKAMVNFVGQTTLGQTAALMASCDVLVTTDSGPLHIADALGVPMVALFSSKNHLNIWRPCQSRSVVLNVAVPCGPCFLPVCPKTWPCIDQIAPADVVAAMTGLLDECRQ